MIKNIIAMTFLLVSAVCSAQVGERRSDLAAGVSAGYVLSDIGFYPNVPQSWLSGKTGGITVRYTSEKYFKSICAIVAEVNYIQTGWKENILDEEDNPVTIAAADGEDSGEALSYIRRMTYLQIPVFARLGWGGERRGFQFFFQAGPQIGLFLNEKTETNFDRFTLTYNSRAANVTAQDTMAVENTFDYGIGGGIGMEYSHPHIGHILLEGRYYYALGDIYGNSKRDYFGRSNIGNIVVKLTYLFDITRTRGL